MIRDNLALLMAPTPVTEQFTGLILLSGVDREGITEALFSVLARAPYLDSVLYLLGIPREAIEED
ncbi:MAG: hypothetical protein EXQ76_01045 [Candidatus Planktophila sp.]|nr:hypothetical protein [Candidatus Planktophila sp.]